MIASSVRRESSWTIGDGLAWVRARPWYYAYAVFALWGLIPGLRRLIDWKSSFSSISIVSIVPLVALVPAAFALFVAGRATKLDRSALTAAWLWFGAFAYAYAIGIAAGNFVSATYTFFGFMLPPCFALYLSTLDVPLTVLYERIAKFALALSVPIAAYSFFQFVAPPPWDLLWMQRTALVSIGIPAPFAFRPFSTLNAPGPFADFLIGVVILNLPRMRSANPLRFAAIALDVAALALTLVRADWIGLLLAVLVFIALSPRKLQNLSLVGIVAIVLTLFAANAGSLLGSSQAGADLQKRFDTLTTITTDSSYRERQNYFGGALANAFAQPVGTGLGVLGTAAKLGSAGATVDFDNGYIARFTEMGYFGMLAYLATLLTTLVLTYRRWVQFDREGNTQWAAIAAAALGMQVALVFLDISSDHHTQLGGIFFWLSFALIYSRGVARDAAR